MKKILLTLILLSFSTVQMFAQSVKLPNVQTGNNTPPVVKVDGDLKEWNDTFQAYNKQTKLFYTISNDDQLLYLAVKSTDLPTSNKIAAGGISFVINTDGKKKDKDAFSLTYPVVTRTAGQGGGRGTIGGGGRQGDRNAPPDSAAVAAQHKQTIDNAKEIKVSGFKDIADSLVSVYNEYGIKAAIGYDAAGNYNYELVLPLKFLNLTPATAKDMAYHITVNGITMAANFTPRDSGGNGGNGGGFGGGGAGGFGGARGGQMGGSPGGPGGSDMFAPTDFWGMYSFAKK